MLAGSLSGSAATADVPSGLDDTPLSAGFSVGAAEGTRSSTFAPSCSRGGALLHPASTPVKNSTARIFFINALLSKNPCSYFSFIDQRTPGWFAHIARILGKTLLDAA